MRVLGALFRRLFLTRLLALFDAGKLSFFNALAGLASRKAFLRYLSPIRKKRWVVYAKPPFAGPQAVLAYLSRYTHRVAISNRWLISFNEVGVTFCYKDYRCDGAERQQVIALATDEFRRCCGSEVRLRACRCPQSLFTRMPSYRSEKLQGTTLGRTGRVAVTHGLDSLPSKTQLQHRGAVRV